MVKEYAALLEMYHRMFGMVDAFHFNSQNTEHVYGKYLDIPSTSRVIPITHRCIRDCRRRRNYNVPVLRLGFIGNETPYKGLPILKSIIGKLNNEGYTNRISLHVYGGRNGTDYTYPNVFYRGRFTPAMMAQVFDDMDLLIVPSICYETFSLVTVEAISFGTCVLVSNKVGAKDIVKTYSPSFVYSEKEELFELLKELTRDRTPLQKYNEEIMKKDWDFSIEKHSEKMINFYESIL